VRSQLILHQWLVVDQSFELKDLSESLEWLFGPLPCA
jgi:hypothetical protein